MAVQVGHLPDPYQLDAAYVGGRPIGKVGKIVMDEPDTDRLGPYIRQALREGFKVRPRELGSESPEEAGC